MTGTFAAHPVLASATLAVAVAAAVRGTWSPCGLSMVSAINPLSERSRGHRYFATALWFVLGAMVGGLALGALGAAAALVLGGLSPTVATAAAGLCCLVGAAADGRLLRLPLIPRQVNERWLGRYRRWVYATGFGAQIGFGLATYVMTAAVFLVPLLGGLGRSWQLAMLAGVLFGLIRGAAVLLTARIRTADALFALHRRLAALAEVSVRAVLAVEVGAALCCGAQLAGATGLAVIAGIAALGAAARRGRPGARAAAPAAGNAPA